MGSLNLLLGLKPAASIRYRHRIATEDSWVAGHMTVFKPKATYSKNLELGYLSC
jgi:hypothetical protein